MLKVGGSGADARVMPSAPPSPGVQELVGQGDLADIAQLELNRRDMELCGILATEDWSRYADRPGHLPGWLSNCSALVITDHRQQGSLADIIRKHLAGVPVYAIEF